MTATCVEKLSHSCGSSDALQVFQENDQYSGYCFACDTYVPDPYSSGQKPVIKIKSPAEIQAELDFIKSLGVDDLHDRKLNKETLTYFGVKVGKSEADGSTIASHFYPYTKKGETIGYKCRIVEGKQIFAIGSTKGAEMFGWEQAIASGNRRLYITEGEIDAMTVWQVLKKKQLTGAAEYRDLNPAVVSLPHGAASADKTIVENSVAMLSIFKEVVLVFDNDDAGKAAVEAVKKKYSTALTITYPGKDPSDCYLKGHVKALTNALIFKAEEPKNSSVVDIHDYLDAVMKPVPRGLDFLFPQLTAMTRGLRWGEVYYIGAGVKMGKSTLVDALVSWFAVKQELDVIIAKPEESVEWTSKHIMGYTVGKIFHDSNIPIDPADVVRADELLKNRVHMIKKYQQLTWNVLKQEVLYSIQKHNSKILIIDPITNLTNGIAASEVDTMLRGIAQEIAMFAMEQEIAVFMFCHLKAPDAGPPHERGGKVMSHQFTGSRAMMRSCQYMLGLEGDKDPDLPIEMRNMRRLVMLEDRQYGSSGIVNLWYDDKTGLFNEVKEV